MSQQREIRKISPLHLEKYKITLGNMEHERYEEGQPRFTEEDLALLEGIGHTIHRPAGDTFFLEGERGEYALLIEKGYVKVLSGSPPRIIAVRGPGEIVGEMAVLSWQPRNASVIAFNDVEALYLPGQKLLDFLYERPRTMHALLVTQVKRHEESNRTIVESELAIGQQLALKLLMLADSGLGERTPEGTVVLRQLSQDDMAELIGTKKKIYSVKKVLRLLKAAGTIDTGRMEITILDLAALRDVANGDVAVSS
jgi:CRP/FNR family cyclic AMP-dependent transcriptional regulator